MPSPHVVLYIAASLDGFIARRDGDVSWLDPFNSPEEDHGYHEFMETVDVSIMGSRTYEQTLSFETATEEDVRKLYVVTKRQLPKRNSSVEFYAGDVSELVNGLKATLEKNIWLVGGSQLITSFMNRGLVDQVMLFVVPVILTEGVPLFDNIHEEISLRLRGSQSYATGLVKLHYDIAR